MAATAAIKAAKILLNSPETKKKIKNILVGFLCFGFLLLSMCGLAFQQDLTGEVAKWFRPQLTKVYYANLSEKSEPLDTRFLYATYIVLFYEEDHQTNEGRRNRVINDLLSCFFEVVQETETVEVEVEVENKDGEKETQIKKETKTVERYKVITNTKKVYENISNKFRIKITEDKKNEISKMKEMLSNLRGFGNASQLSDFALQFVGENHTRFTTYKSHNGSGFGDNWCAMFVSYCTDNMGYIDDGVIHWFVGCTSAGILQFRKEGRFEEGYAFGGTYVPQPGDIIFFNWDGGNSMSHHVGIVTEMDGSLVRTVEGNRGGSWSSSTVQEYAYEYKSSYVVGYFPLSQYVEDKPTTSSPTSPTKK